MRLVFFLEIVIGLRMSSGLERVSGSHDFPGKYIKGVRHSRPLHLSSLVNTCRLVFHAISSQLGGISDSGKRGWRMLSPCIICSSWGGRVSRGPSSSWCPALIWLSFKPIGDKPQCSAGFSCIFAVAESSCAPLCSWDCLLTVNLNIFLDKLGCLDEDDCVDLVIIWVDFGSFKSTKVMRCLLEAHQGGLRRQ